MPTDGTLLLEHMPNGKQYLVTALSVFFSVGAVFAAVVGLIVIPSRSCPPTPAPCDVSSQNMGWKYLLVVLGLVVSPDLVSGSVRFIDKLAHTDLEHVYCPYRVLQIARVATVPRTCGTPRRSCRSSAVDIQIQRLGARIRCRGCRRYCCTPSPGLAGTTTTYRSRPRSRRAKIAHELGTL